MFIIIAISILGGRTIESRRIPRVRSIYTSALYTTRLVISLIYVLNMIKDGRIIEYRTYMVIFAVSKYLYSAQPILYCVIVMNGRTVEHRTKFTAEAVMDSNHISPEVSVFYTTRPLSTLILYCNRRNNKYSHKTEYFGIYPYMK